MESPYLAALISDCSYFYQSLLFSCDKTIKVLVGFR